MKGMKYILKISTCLFITTFMLLDIVTPQFIVYATSSHDNKEKTISIEDQRKNTASIQLDDQFYVQSWITSGKRGPAGEYPYFYPNIDVSEDVQNQITGNIMEMNTPDNPVFTGYSDAGYYYQQTSLTYKNSIDMTKNFVINGSLKTDSTIMSIMGMAFAFHTEEGYRYGGGDSHAGNLAIYNQGSGLGLNGPALTAEIDGYDNPSGLQDISGVDYTILGDDGKYNDDGHGAHLKIHSFKRKTQRIYTYPGSIVNFHSSKINGVNTPFELKWNANKDGKSGILSLTVDGIGTSKSYVNLENLFGYGTNFKKMRFTIGSGAGAFAEWVDTYEELTPGANKPVNYTFKFDGFRYTDIEPHITTQIITEDGLENTRIGEKVRIRHIVKNISGHQAELNDVLNLKQLSVGDTKLTAKNIRIGTDLDTLKSYTGRFDEENPLSVIYPENGREYYIEYEVDIPDFKHYGVVDELKVKVALGQNGMSQTFDETSKEVWNIPLIESRLGSSNISKYENIFVNNVDEITEQSIWENIWVKTATSPEIDISNAYLGELSSSEAVTIDYNYFKESYNGIEDLGTDFPINIVPGETYGVNIKVIDKKDTKLINTFTRRMTFSDNNESNDSVHIFANNITLTETKLSTLNIDDFQEFVKNESKARAYIMNDDSSVTNLQVQVDINDWINSLGFADKKAGTYDLKLSTNCEKGTATVNIKVNVIANTWSYDTEGRTEENGASGYIVIPKGIKLKNGVGSDTGKIVADGKVYFANYKSNKKYKVKTDPKFKIINDENGSEVEVVTKVNSNDGESCEVIGLLDRNNNKNNPLTFKLEALNNEVNKIKGCWKGSMTFYFELQ
ncbi:TPA: hypothetical protein I9014_001704 [Clostridium perfringens]|nr:hypothetical protein [Clostridium perfringens]